MNFQYFSKKYGEFMLKACKITIFALKSLNAILLYIYTFIFNRKILNIIIIKPRSKTFFKIHKI